MWERVGQGEGGMGEKGKQGRGKKEDSFYFGIAIINITRRTNKTLDDSNIRPI